MSLTLVSIVGALLAAFWCMRVWWLNAKARHKKTADANELEWLDELVREHEAPGCVGHLFGFRFAA
jgi:hypothetical protein